MKDVGIVELLWSDQAAIAEAAALIARIFDDPLQYSPARIEAELQPAVPPLHRQFFAAYSGGRMVGAAGLKSADWASGTAVLYLSVVAPEFRGRGIGRALVKARVAWLRGRLPHGRVLVSTAKPRRFLDLGFCRVNRKELGGRSLMFLEY
jgi:GNAT superfamily N-acetyltransferase